MIVRTNSNYILITAFIFGWLILVFPFSISSQRRNKPFPATAEKKSIKVLYGQASYYASKFNGRATAGGDIFNQEKLTAACNVLPLGTWVRVTNLKNGKHIIVRTNDRLHVRTRRLLDLTKAGAKKLGYLDRGLTRVKIEILNQQKYTRRKK